MTSVAQTTAGLSARIVVSRSNTFTLDLEVAIEPGTTAALLGPNGSGKSTTVDALAGIVPLDEGRIQLDGRVLDDPDAGVFVPTEQRGLGVVFQQGLLFDHLDVAANIAFGPRSAGRPSKQADAIARRWIDTLDLADLADRHPNRLSGGQAQRVALARALATDPDLLMLDEPIAGMSARERELTAALLQRICKNRSVIVIEHDMDFVKQIAHKVTVMHQGKILAEGSMEKVQNDPKVIDVYLGH